jgi:tetratricopeptide (TPR) repeat protein
MSKKILFFLFLLIVIGFVSYIFYLNPNEVLVSLGGSKTIETPMAVVLISTFCLGLFASALVAFYFATKQKIALWITQKKLAAANDHEQQTLQAKVAFWSERDKVGEKLLLRTHPNQTGYLLSQVILIENLITKNDFEKARSILEPLRVQNFDNLALLSLSASLNEKQENYTAALDNLSVILKSDPENKFALRKSIENLKKLSRFSKAIELQQQLIHLLSGEVYREAQEELAKLQLDEARARYAESKDEQTFEQELLNVLKQHKEFPSALGEIARLKAGSQDYEEASDCLVRAYLVAGEVNYLDQLVSMWLSAQNPAKAISYLQKINSKKDKDSFSCKAKIVLAKLYVRLEMLEHANSEIEELDKLKAEVNGCAHEVTKLEASLLMKQKSYAKACDRLSELANLS